MTPPREPACPRCLDTGWIFVTAEGRETARPCECRSNQSRDRLRSHANIPPRFERNELKGFLPHKKNESQARAKQLAERFVKDYPAVEGGLLFQGPTGVGKTLLLCAIGNQLIREKQADVYYIDWNDLVRSMRSGEDYESRDYASINARVQRLAAVEVLLFDELGASRASPWVEDNIYFIINRRYNERRTTLFASNFTDTSENGEETLQQRIGERIRSRIYEMTQKMEIKGEDRRPQL